MSFPEPKTFNGAPGEVMGDDRRGGGRAPKVAFVCADCGWLGANAITACEHADRLGHRICFPSGRTATFNNGAQRQKQTRTA